MFLLFQQGYPRDSFLSYSACHFLLTILLLLLLYLILFIKLVINLLWVLKQTLVQKQKHGATKFLLDHAGSFLMNMLTLYLIFVLHE